MNRFDATDRQLLHLLREDGRASHAKLAKDVGLSAPAVGERIRKLEQAGVILGYEANLDPSELDLPICAFVALAPSPGTNVADLVERLETLKNVEELHSTAGTYSYMIKVRAQGPTDLDGFLDRLMMMPGIERTETTMVLRTHMERPVPLPFDAT